MTPNTNIHPDTNDELSMYFTYEREKRLGPTPDMRFEAFKQNVRRYFKNDIRHKKDAQCSINRVTGHLQLLW